MGSHTINSVENSVVGNTIRYITIVYRPYVYFVSSGRSWIQAILENREIYTNLQIDKYRKNLQINIIIIITNCASRLVKQLAEWRSVNQDIPRLNLKNTI